MRFWITISLLALLVGTGRLYAQEGYSSGSVSLSRERALKAQRQVRAYPPNPGYSQHPSPVPVYAPAQTTVYQSVLPQPLTRPEEIVVEEFMNYHRHQIALPEGEEEIALEMRANHLQRTEAGDLYAVQVGIATRGVLYDEPRQPVHVSIVVDCSGSMNADFKMDKVKRALQTFIAQLSPGDLVSLTQFSNDATAVQPLTSASSQHYLQQQIQSLYPSGSTNLFAGLELGLQQLYNYSDHGEFAGNLTRRVILLTDGVANLGLTAPHQIMGQVQPYLNSGIQISTIGVGEDVNFELLKGLAEKSGGQNHFIGSSEEDISKVFLDEVQSLIAPVAREVSLDISFPRGIEIDDFFGYAPAFYGQHIKLLLQPMNRGLTQVFIFTCLVPRGMEETWLEAKLTGTLLHRPRPNTWKAALPLEAVRSNERGWTDAELMKNYHIALMATTMKEVAIKSRRNDCRGATESMMSCEAIVNSAFPYLQSDPDVRRVLEILVAYTSDWTQFACGGDFRE